MDKHTRTGIALTVVFASVLACLLAWANAPVSRTFDMGATLAAEPSVTVGPVEYVYTIAPVYVVADKRPAKARKRICDRRGNTVSVTGYASGRMVETRDASETTAIVCWAE